MEWFIYQQLVVAVGGRIYLLDVSQSHFVSYQFHLIFGTQILMVKTARTCHIAPSLKSKVDETTISDLPFFRCGVLVSSPKKEVVGTLEGCEMGLSKIT